MVKIRDPFIYSVCMFRVFYASIPVVYIFVTFYGRSFENNVRPPEIWIIIYCLFTIFTVCICMLLSYHLCYASVCCLHICREFPLCLFIFRVIHLKSHVFFKKNFNLKPIYRTQKGTHSAHSSITCSSCVQERGKMSRIFLNIFQELHQAFPRVEGCKIKRRPFCRQPILSRIFLEFLLARHCLGGARIPRPMTSMLLYWNL